MTNVYVEPPPKEKVEGTPIKDYVVEDHADNVLATFDTQEHVARVRHLNDKKKPDQWRRIY